MTNEAIKDQLEIAIEEQSCEVCEHWDGDNDGTCPLAAATGTCDWTLIEGGK